MKYQLYQRKINDVITKCPIEAGIEILVYNLIDEYLDIDNYALVDINRIWKNQDSRLSTEGGIPDIAVLSPNFIFKKEDSGKVYGFIEVKSAGMSLSNTSQIHGQLEKVNHYIYTNGIVWKYYYNKKKRWEKNIGMDKKPYSISEIIVDEKVFEELVKELRSIKWTNAND